MEILVGKLNVLVKHQNSTNTDRKMPDIPSSILIYGGV